MKKLSMALAGLLVALFLFTGCNVFSTPANNTPPNNGQNPTSVPTDTFGEKMTTDRFEMGIADGWQQDDSISTVDMIMAPDGASSINVVIEKLPGAYTPAEYMEAAASMLDTVDMFKGRTELPTGNLQVGNYESASYKYAIVSSGLEMTMTQCVVIADQSAFVITYTAVNGADYDSSVAEMLRSFRIL